MATIVQFQVAPEQAKDESFLRFKIQKEVKTENFTFKWKKRSVDARNRNIKINCTFNVYLDGEVAEDMSVFVPNKELKGEIGIIGFGPAGIFAALRAIELGIKPIVFERGKDVRSRRRDLALLNKESIVNPESNYCMNLRVSGQSCLFLRSASRTYRTSVRKRRLNSWRTTKLVTEKSKFSSCRSTCFLIPGAPINRRS